MESCFGLQQSGFMGFVAKLLKSTFQFESLRDGHLQESKSLLLTLHKKLSLCLVLKINGKVMNDDPVERICGLGLGFFLNRENLISLSQTAMTEPKADSSSGGEFNSNMTADQLHKRPVNDTEKNGSHYQADEESQQNNNNDVVVEGATDLSEPTEWLADVGYYDILKQFSLMGWVAFGGPAAHIALFQKVSLGIYSLTRFQSARTSSHVR